MCLAVLVFHFFGPIILISYNIVLLSVSCLGLAPTTKGTSVYKRPLVEFIFHFMLFSMSCLFPFVRPLLLPLLPLPPVVWNPLISLFLFHFLCLHPLLLMCHFPLPLPLPLSPSPSPTPSSSSPSQDSQTTNPINLLPIETTVDLQKPVISPPVIARSKATIALQGSCQHSPNAN